MDKEMLKALVAAKTPYDVQVVAKEHGIELSDENAAILFADIEKMRESATGSKVSDEELAEVAGGYAIYHTSDGRQEFVYDDSDFVKRPFASAEEDRAYLEQQRRNNGV